MEVLSLAEYKKSKLRMLSEIFEYGNEGATYYNVISYLGFLGVDCDNLEEFSNQQEAPI